MIIVSSSPKSFAAPVDERIAALAAAQHGVVARQQLLALGLDANAVTYRLRIGRLHRLHAGVYAVGHPVVGRHGRWIAATLACGPGAALSHAAAGVLWGLRPSSAVYIDVTVPATTRRRHRGLRVHTARKLHADVTTHDGIPVTTPARTILDLAAVLQRRPLERLLDQAENARLTDVAALDALARAHAGHRGASKLLAALDTHTPGTTLTRSELEDLFLGLCDHAGLPRRLVNTWPEGYEVDFLFPQARLIVETDSWRHHRTRAAFERDRQRDAVHARAGYRTLRFTHAQLTTQAGTVAATVAAELGERRAA
ncbi:MAG TPA: DUF559 domain-containing protein [Solirubrobacteraceae bacterium]|nr:DUF559 domain-containing protein [Solirubrobacteraceae bacterium]